MPAFVSGKNLNSKIQVACIGVGGKGRSDTMNAAKCGGQIVGLCDIPPLGDDAALGGGAHRGHP